MRVFRAIGKLRIPTFSSTEQAMEWGSHLNAEQHALLVEEQRSASDTALGEFDLQRMADLATQSQLMREAAEACKQRGKCRSGSAITRSYRGNKPVNINMRGRLRGAAPFLFVIMSPLIGILLGLVGAWILGR